jgi:hypothetical protein
MNYTSLSTLVQQYLENEETSFVANMGQFVKSAEEEIFRHVQIPDLRKNSTSTIDDGEKYFSLPDDYLATYSIAAISSNTYSYLVEKEVNYLREAYPDQTVEGTPRFYATWDDDTMIVAPTSDGLYSLELHYFYRPVSLSEASPADGTQTTWLSTNAENAILYGTIMHGYIYEKGDQDVIAAYSQKFQNALDQLKVLCEGMNRKDTYRKENMKRAV